MATACVERFAREAAAADTAHRRDGEEAEEAEDFFSAAGSDTDTAVRASPLALSDCSSLDGLLGGLRDSGGTMVSRTTRANQATQRSERVEQRVRVSVQWMGTC
jgi:hypothetical protein